VKQEPQSLTISSASPASTEALAAKLGHSLKGGEVIELLSDLGGGKTTFVRGLVKGLGSTSQVSSPTFKIKNVYRSHALTINHFDFYRLNEPGLIANEIDESFAEPDVVTIIEWPDIVDAVLPPKRLSIEITIAGEQERKLAFHYSEELAYLLEGIVA
jgi:tRNA threonylcarbamoyladenosine biosynthesis protein TsaE